MTLNIDAKFEEKLIFCFKNDKNLASLQNFYFHLLLLCKVFNVWPKKVQRSYLSWHRRVMKNLKKNWLVKWHEEYGEFSPEHLKVSKLGFWWDPLFQTRKSISLRIHRGVTCPAMKNDGKCEEELTCHFIIDMRNLMNFDPST